MSRQPAIHGRLGIEVTEDIPKAIEAIPDQWIPIALILVFCSLVIWLVVKLALKQHTVIVQIVSHGQIMHELVVTLQENIRLLTSIHSIVSRGKHQEGAKK